MLDLGESRLGEVAERLKELANVIVGEAIRDGEAVLYGFHEPRGAKNLEVLRDVGPALIGLRGKHFDRPRRLTEQIQEIEPRGVRDAVDDDTSRENDFFQALQIGATPRRGRASQQLEPTSAMVVAVLTTSFGRSGHEEDP